MKSSPSSGGVALMSVGRDLMFEAALIERLGKLVCEGALIEVVDVHKEASFILANKHMYSSVLYWLKLN